MLLAFLVAASASSVGVIVWLHFFADDGLPTRNRKPVAGGRLAAAFERKMAAWTRLAPFAPASRLIGQSHRLRALVAGFRGALSRQTRAVSRGQSHLVGTITRLRIHIRHGFERLVQSPVGALSLLGQVRRAFLGLVGKFQAAAHPRETEMGGDPGRLGVLDSDKPTQPLILPRRDRQRRPRRALDVNEQLQFGLGQTGPVLTNGNEGKLADPAMPIVPKDSRIKRTIARLDDQAAVRIRRPHRRAHQIKHDRTDPAFIDAAHP